MLLIRQTFNSALTH